MLGDSLWLGECSYHDQVVRLQTGCCEEFMEKGCDSCQLFSPTGPRGHLMAGCGGHCGAMGLDIATVVPVCGGWVCREGDCSPWRADLC